MFNKNKFTHIEQNFGENISRFHDAFFALSGGESGSDNNNNNINNFCLFRNQIDSKEISLCASYIKQAQEKNFDVLLSSQAGGMELCNSLCDFLVHDKCFNQLNTLLTIEEQNQMFQMLVQLFKREEIDGRRPNNNISIIIDKLANHIKSSNEFGTLTNKSQAIINERLEEGQPISNLGYKGYYK